MTEERAAPGHSDPPFRRRSSVLRAALGWARDLMLSVVIAFIVIIFIYQPVKVEGTSMMPTLVDQERIFVNKFIYRLGIDEIKRGDTIVFWFPFDQSKSYIKRVIGIPGDTVAIDRGTVILNGKPLKEDYVPPEYRDNFSMPEQRVRANEYFVLGDRRNSSNDSRTWGLVPRECIYGKAVFVYWPLTRIGPLK
ncbi:MAG TPA: signal peptidase I [Bryobacteraceae bacterium]|nr:signal peptidase I [Bryobacteraceae bacterium]HOQ45609.1 signal peptidase I [Bryobacteraceae bacterium]HPU72758.1 signal peptidase I [Bryobacteraceae bacterium]